MANTRELRRRIRSVKNTAQITKAMQMVSATKMRKAQNQAFAGRPYAATLYDVLSATSGMSADTTHVLLQANQSHKVGVILFTTDKGLAGALNTNLLRVIQANPLFQGNEVMYFTVGKKGRDFIIRTNKVLEADFENHDHVEMVHATRIRKLLVQMFMENMIGDVYLLYPDFKSTLRQESKMTKILPIVYQNLQGGQNGQKFLFEPSVVDVIDYALLHHLDTQIYQALLETKASEHSARMLAMQNATNNAKDLVEDLQLTYNQVRQSAITTQILEIASGSAD